MRPRWSPWTRALLAGLGGWAIYRLWHRFGLPPRGRPLDAPFPGLWRWFFAVWLPLLFPAFSLAHARVARLAREASRPVTERALAWDRRSYVALPLFLAALGAWRHLGDWRLALGAIFLGVLFGKTLGLVVTLYRLAVAGPPDGPAWPLARELTLAALLLYAFLTPYVVTAISTTGDEHLYLLNTVSLYTDHDLDIRDNVERRDYERFYWGRPSPAEWRSRFVGFPLLLLPGYALGDRLLPAYPLAGRLGATLTVTLFAALLGGQVYRLCRELGASPPAAFWAWLVVALTPPVLVNASHVYPEIPAAWAAVAGARRVWRVRRWTWASLAAVSGAAAFMALLKDRYLPLGAGLVVAGLVELVWRQARRRLLATALLLGLAGLGAYLVIVNPAPALFPKLEGPEALLVSLRTWDRRTAEAALGILADQEFGLLHYAPQWVLVVLGVPLVWRWSRSAAAGLLGVTGFYLLVLVQHRWDQWDAGWTPPPRFILPAIPLLAPFVAAAYERCRGRALAAANTVWLVWGGAVAYLVSVEPFWRYNNLTGRTTLLRLVEDWTSLDLARFLPSLRAPTAWTWAVLAAGALALGVAAVLARRRTPERRDWGAGAVLLRPVPAVGLVLGLAGLWVAAAAVVPTWSIEAEAMRHVGGVQYGSYTYQEVLWVMTREGEMSEPIVTWPGETTITVFAGGMTTTGTAPRMTLLLDGQPVETWALQSGRHRWWEAAYAARVRTGFGRSTLTLRFTSLLDRRSRNAPDQVQHAYVDRVRLRWHP